MSVTGTPNDALLSKITSVEVKQLNFFKSAFFNLDLIKYSSFVTRRGYPLPYLFMHRSLLV